MGWVIALGILLAIGYLISLRLQPFTPLPGERGLGTPGLPHGFINGYAHRRCRRCGGTNRQERLGPRLEPRRTPRAPARAGPGRPATQADR